MSASPASTRWLIPALFAVLGAGVSAAAWLALDRLGVGAGPGRLQGVGWPFDSLPVVGAFGAFGGAIVGRIVHARRILRQEAEADPIEPSPETDDATESEDSPLPDLPAFAGRVDVSRRSARRVGDVTADVFDLTTEDSTGEDVTLVTRTVVLLPADGLPAFDLRPRRSTDRILAWAGAEGLRFDAAAAGRVGDAAVVKRFTTAYRLTSASPEAMLSGTGPEGDDDGVRRVFTLGTMRVVLNRSDWMVQSHGGHLACWEATDRRVPRNVLGPKRRARLVADAVSLRTALLAAQAGTRGDRIIPAPAGAESSARQAGRLRGSLLGGFLGLLAGTFLAFLIDIALFFDGPGRPPESVVGLGAGLFVVFILAGTALGAAIGRLMPVRRAAPRVPVDPRREKVLGCAVLAGAFGGFMGGPVVGAVLGEVIGLEIDDMQKRALLIFGGAGVGLVTGPIILWKVVNLVYRLRGRIP